MNFPGENVIEPAFGHRNLPRATFLVLLACLICALNSYAQEVTTGAIEIKEIKHDESPALRDIPPAQSQVGADDEIRLNPRMPNPSGINQQDTVVQNSPFAMEAPTLGAPTLGVNFDGVGKGLGSYAPCCAPPDTNGAVGPNHYLQTVNLDFAVFSKSGAVLLGPVPINTLWSGFGGGCQSNNDGDPIVLYDKIAGRWLIAQFSVNTTPYLECVAISTTSDPTGSYFRYAFDHGTTDFPDYPKAGIWPDAYYSTYNIFAGGTTFAGSKVCAWDRAKMLIGAPATQQCFNTSSAFGGLLPSDLDGALLPPSGSPNYVLGLDTTTTLVAWKFHVDWTTPANTTFTGPTSIAVAGYTAACPTQTRGACIPQGGTTQTLEALSDRLMYRLAYRNLGDHEALVVNHAVEVGSGSSLHVGVRWYELRPDANRNLRLFQQGTYAPDNGWRWMGSAAMDKAGSIALGYSVSSPAFSPQIHFTGRLAGDPAGIMTQGESVIINGTGSQLPSLARWGDYSSMSVDPVDDCTFWYTTEYLKASGAFNWSTRIASFKLPGCGVSIQDFSISASPSSQTVTAGMGASYTATVAASGGFTGTVTFGVSGLPTGASASFSPAMVTTSGSSTMTVTTSSSTVAGSYPLIITGTSGTLSHTASVALVVNAAPVPDFSISASPSSQTVIMGASTSYTTTVMPSGGFAGTVAFNVGGLPTGATGSFSPASVTTSGSSNLTVATTSSTPTGSYPLTISGTSGTLSHSASVTLVVNAAPVPDIVFARSGGIWVMNADGTNQTNILSDLSHNYADPVWSPDGTQIAFSSNRDQGNDEIYVMNADGSNITRVTDVTFASREPAWSPDGTMIAFDSNQDGLIGSIYTINVDGSNLMRVTNAFPASDQAPAWSPNGTQIAFWTNEGGIGLHIAVVNVDGTGRNDFGANMAFGINPAWSPDGTQIAYSGSGTGASQIIVMNADGTGQTNLSNSGFADNQPAWSPDGTMISFERNFSGQLQVFVMNAADGSGQTQLTNDSSFQPDWRTPPAPPL